MVYDTLIIGSGPGGLTAALYLKRAGYNVKIIAGESIGGNLAKISLIENYPGVLSISGKDLADNMIKQCLSLNIEIDYFNSVVSIVNNVATLSDGSFCSARSFIVAIGSIPNLLHIEDEKEALEKNYIKFCATCDGPLYKNKNVAVLGGGNSAIDFCCALSKYCKSIILIHRRDVLRADKLMQSKLTNLPNVSLALNNIVTNYSISPYTKLLEITAHNKFTDKIEHFIVDGIFYALGYTPNILSINNTINVKYVGDCIDQVYRQVITACGDGCKVAMDLEKVL